MNAQVQVHSEIDPLRRVIIHEPDSGISRVSPKRSHELLFDDIVYLPHMIQEHRIFRRVLEQFLGEEHVYETQQLLAESLSQDEETRETIIKWVLDFEELPTSYLQQFNKYDNAKLAEVLISGYDPDEDYIYFDPIPNFIFTRDIAAVINDHVLITKAAKSARYRENFLTRSIFWSHPHFRGLKEEGKVINLNHVDLFPPSRRGEPICLEGGDVMILNQDYLLIGSSERTNEHTIHALKKVLFERDIVRNVVQIVIPPDRSFMHIDTIFTQIAAEHIVAYKPIVVDGLSSYVNVFRKGGAQAFYPSIEEFFHAEINSKIDFIHAGQGISPYQEREQWTDGCNLVALKPGVALTYDRNPFTEKALIEHGYQIMHAQVFLRSCDTGHLNPETIENTIITLPSNELSRARGGSHCMTCPILRG